MLDRRARPDYPLSMIKPADTVLILDFGSQVTQLIARRVREVGVYCEIVPFAKGGETYDRLQPRAVILSGSPASVADAGSPRIPGQVLAASVPILGICYGEQVLCEQTGGKVGASGHREFGRADIEIVADCALFDGVWAKGDRPHVWMSHGDRIEAIPVGFRPVAVTAGAPFAAIADDERRRYGVQFHPEVHHTPDGGRLLANFVTKIAGIVPKWTMAGFREAKIAEIRKQVGTEKVLCGLSGGVDSSVAALLIHEAIGDQLTCVFVDHGLLREGEAEQVVSLFREHYHIPLVHVDASDTFLAGLAGAMAERLCSEDGLALAPLDIARFIARLMLTATDHQHVQTPPEHDQRCDQRNHHWVSRKNRQRSDDGGDELSLVDHHFGFDIDLERARRRGIEFERGLFDEDLGDKRAFLDGGAIGIEPDDNRSGLVIFRPQVERYAYFGHFTIFRAASVIFAARGRIACSIGRAKGIGISGVQMRTGAARRTVGSRSTTDAMTSPDTP